MLGITPRTGATRKPHNNAPHLVMTALVVLIVIAQKTWEACSPRQQDQIAKAATKVGHSLSTFARVSCFR